MLAPPSADDLGAKGRELRKVLTKEGGGAAVDTGLINTLASLYNKNGGDVAKIAKECGADVGLMKKYPPKGANDFAEKLLLGIYTKAGGDIVISIGPPSAASLQEQGKQLKKVVTSVKNGAPAENELEAIGGIFQRCSGDLEKISAATGANLQLLRKSPPKDSLDFAAKLLLGMYTDAFAAVGAATVGERLVVSVADLQRTVGALKKVDAAAESTICLEADIKNLQAIFDQKNGSFEVLANMCGISFELLRKDNPKDSLVFAQKVLDGAYTDIKSEEFRSRFGGYLMMDELMQNGQRLKAVGKAQKDVKPKEGGLGGPESSDVEIVAKIFDANSGDLAALVALCGIDGTVLRKNPPATRKEFATKLLAGHYVA